MLGRHSLIQGLVVEIQVFDDQLCGPHRDHLVLVALVGFVVLILSQLFSAIKSKSKFSFKRSKTKLHLKINQDS